MPDSQKLRFVHLSDIHFSNRVAGFGFDPDREIRNRLLIDIEKRCAELGRPNALLVSGDIAYAGKRSEYENAAQWLDSICDAVGCARDAVYLCPGNHDVDQQVIRDNSMIADSQDAVRREQTLFEQDRALSSRLVQPVARDLFYAPLREYNEFAARYGSTFYADGESFAWDRDFVLNDGSILRLRAMNSAILSGLQDAERTLFLGSRAWTMPMATDVEYMSMTHHPPSWLLDRREAEGALNGIARIQLSGHEHDQRIVPGRDWVKLYAGSVNPHRAEPNWRPGYNIFEVFVEDGDARKMIIDVHAREWQGEPPQFRALEDVNNERVHRTKIDLPPLRRVRGASGANPRAVGALNDAAPSAARTDAAAPVPTMRVIVNRFFRLSQSQKNEIVGSLGLAEDEDNRLPDFERFKLALQRAQRGARLAEVETMIAAKEHAG